LQPADALTREELIGLAVRGYVPDDQGGFERLAGDAASTYHRLDLQRP